MKQEVNERIAKLEVKVEAMLTNHLPHLQIGIDKLEERLTKQDWFLITILVGIVINFLYELVKR